MKTNLVCTLVLAALLPLGGCRNKLDSGEPAPAASAKPAAADKAAAAPSAPAAEEKPS